MKRKSFNPDADLDNNLDEYEPSDSDDDYDDNEKFLLDKVRKGKSLDDDDDDDDESSENEEEVLGVYSSEEESNQKDDGKDGVENMDSDIEGMEDDDKLPDPKAWGKRKKDYYHTDYIDQDYGGFGREEEEEAALMEENEARTLQSRLAALLDNVDLSSSLGLTSKDVRKNDKLAAEKSDEDEGAGVYVDVVKTDLSKLTKREKLMLLQKESPEYFGLINDYKERLTFAKENLFPVMELIKCKRIPSNLPCAKFVELKTHLTLNYCINLAYYLLLKKKRIRVKDHPVISRLLKYRTLLQKMDELETPKYVEQLNDIVAQLTDNGGDIDLLSDSSATNKQKCRKNKTKLKLLTSSLSTTKNNVYDNSCLEKKVGIKMGRKGNSKFEDIIEGSHNFDDVLNDDSESDESNVDQDDSPPNKRLKSLDKSEADDEGKRPITYEIAKNKGLTPHRKKEQRNPRVKHRNKYRKALIRRKGQVRQVQSEVSKYGGEIFGIKASVIKSRRFK